MASVEPVKEGVVGEANQFKIFNQLYMRPSLVFVCCSCNCYLRAVAAAMRLATILFYWAVVQPGSDGEAERGSVSIRF